MGVSYSVFTFCHVLYFLIINVRIKRFRYIINYHFLFIDYQLKHKRSVSMVMTIFM
jgi:hypothetical protein